MVRKQQFVSAFITLAAMAVTMPGLAQAPAEPAPQAKTPVPSLTSGRSTVYSVKILMAKDVLSNPDTHFDASLPKVYASARTLGSNKGDRFRGVWVAVDVPAISSKNLTIAESTTVADSKDFSALFFFNKPDKGFPKGQYRLDVYINDKLSGSVPFTFE